MTLKFCLQSVRLIQMPLFVLHYFSLVPKTYLSIVSNSPKNLALTLSTPTPTATPSAQDFSNFRKLPAFLPSPVFFFFVLPSVIIRPPYSSNTSRSSWNVSILSSSLSIKIIQLSQLPAPSQESKFCLNNQQNKRISLQFWQGFCFLFCFCF